MRRARGRRWVLAAALLVAVLAAAGLPGVGSAGSSSSTSKPGVTTTLSGGVAGSGWENGDFADGAGDEEVRRVKNPIISKK